MCDIYNDRPEICNIYRMYNKHFSDEFSWDEFAVLNMLDCVVLRYQYGIDEPSESPFEYRQQEIAEKLKHGKKIVI